MGFILIRKFSYIVTPPVPDKLLHLHTHFNALKVKTIMGL